MTQAIEVSNGNGADHSAMIESVVIQGDLSKLPGPARAAYYAKVCESIGVNPLTRPFAYIKLKDGSEKLYALRDCADQLRNLRKVTVAIIARETIGEVYVVTARAMTPDGRADESTGAVATKGLTGENLANALMKAETKAKRRVTLSICGLGWLDETEADSIPGAQTEVPRISPHGEPDDGVVYREPAEADALIRGFEEQVNLQALRALWAETGLATVDGYESFHPQDRKRLSAAFKRRERQLAKADRDLTEAMATKPAEPEDL